MPDNNPNKGQVNQYDKILRENLEVTLPVIIREVLGIEVAESEELPDDIQHTKERKPDALKKITTVSGETFLLQIEFQVKSEEDLVYRMAEYAVMLMRRYRLAVRQYVIFLRKKRPSMATFINSEQLKFSYNLLLISEMNYRLFLNSENPEVKMLAILADFANTDSYLVVKEVVEEIREHTKGDFAQSRYFKQLRIFVQLRSSIQPQFETVMQTVSQFFKEENDFLFKKGEAKGVEKERAIADAKMREERAILEALMREEQAKADAKMREEKRNIARAMKADGLPAFQISKFTGLTHGEIEKL